MICVVLSQWNGIYTLRHVLCDIDPSKNLQQVKENYYRDFYRFDTDEFHFCNDMAEVENILKDHNIKI